MGNKPSHRPFEGESPGATGPDRAGTALGRVVGMVRGLVDGLRRRVVGERGREQRPPVPAVRPAERERTELRPVTGTSPSLPRRDRPFTRPTRNERPENPPDLCARTEDGRLSIYFPDHDGAEITSDTWERVEP